MSERLDGCPGSEEEEEEDLWTADSAKFSFCFAKFGAQDHKNQTCQKHRGPLTSCDRKYKIFSGQKTVRKHKRRKKEEEEDVESDTQVSSACVSCYTSKMLKTLASPCDEECIILLQELTVSCHSSD